MSDGASVPLELELIGDNTDHLMRSAQRLLNTAGRRLGDRAMGEPPLACSVHEMMRRPDGTVTRRLLSFQRDYSRANSVGSRGVYACYLLTPGHVYRIHHRTSWRSARTYYAVLRAGAQLREVSEEAAISWLANDH